jgi:hypothetical protein
MPRTSPPADTCETDHSVQSASPGGTARTAVDQQVNAVAEAIAPKSRSIRDHILSRSTPRETGAELQQHVVSEGIAPQDLCVTAKPEPESRLPPSLELLVQRNRQTRTALPFCAAVYD